MQRGCTKYVKEVKITRKEAHRQELSDQVSESHQLPAQGEVGRVKRVPKLPATKAGTSADFDTIRKGFHEIKQFRDCS